MTLDGNRDDAPVAALLAEARLPELGPGRPDRSAETRLRSLRPSDLAAGRRIRDPRMLDACLAALWLRFDFLDESHRISQELESTTGSYWHGIMHRREPDYGNAKYWFRRVGRHPIFPALTSAAARLARQPLDPARPLDPAAAWLADEEPWDAFRFVDLCEKIAKGRSTAEPLARQIAQLEWQLLYEYCLAEALDER